MQELSRTGQNDALRRSTFRLVHTGCEGVEEKVVNWKAWGFSTHLKNQDGNPELLMLEVKVVECPQHKVRSKEFRGKKVIGGFCGE